MKTRLVPSLVLAAVVSLLLGASLQAQDPREIVSRSVERDWTDYGSIKNYTYRERTESRRYSADGKLSSSHSETHEILILGDRPYERLVARDDRPLSEAETRKEQEKLDEEAAKREHVSPARAAQYEKERAEDRAFIREIPDAFTFRLDGMETISNEPAWVIEAEPKRGYHPAHTAAKLFSKVRAKIWIEQATYHWVKVDAEAIEPLWFGFGLVRISPGGTLHFEQKRVNDEIWLPSSIQVRGEARVAFVKKVRAEYDIRYSDYHKFQSDSRIVSEDKK